MLADSVLPGAGDFSARNVQVLSKVISVDSLSLCLFQVPGCFVKDVREESVQEKSLQLRTCLRSAECSRGLFAIPLSQIIGRFRHAETQ